MLCITLTKILIKCFSLIELLKKYGVSSINVKNLSEDFEFDAVYMTSGSDKAIDTALKYVRNGGTILIFSSTPQNFGYPNNEIYYRELTILGSYSPSPKDLEDSLELLKTGQVKVKNLSTIYPQSEVQQAIEDTVSNKIMKAYIKISE